MHLPLVTVAIPTFNRSRYLGEAIQSARQQTIEDLEILIVDDASTDDTPDLVSRVSDDRITYRCQQTRVGAIANANATIDMARGRYYMLLSDDDLISANYIEEMVGLVQNEQVRLAFGSGCDIDESGAPTERRSPVVTGSLSGVDFILQWLDNTWLAAGTPTCLFARRDDLLAVGRFPTFPTTDNVDNAAMMALAVQGDVGLAARATYFYRKHVGNATHQFFWRDRVASAKAMLDYFETHPVFDAHLSGSQRRLVKQGLQTLLAQQFVWATFAAGNTYTLSDLLQAAISFPLSRQYLRVLGRHLGARARSQLMYPPKNGNSLPDK